MKLKPRTVEEAMESGEWRNMVMPIDPNKEGAMLLKLYRELEPKGVIMLPEKLRGKDCISLWVPAQGWVDSDTVQREQTQYAKGSHKKRVNAGPRSMKLEPVLRDCPVGPGATLHPERFN